MKELVSILENRRFEVYRSNVASQITLFDKYCSCILLSDADNPKTQRLYKVFAELLDQRCEVDSTIKRRSRVNSMIVENGLKSNSQPF